MRHALLPAALCATFAAAQQTPPPAFDVVSLKHAGDLQTVMIPAGRWGSTGLRPFRITGNSVSYKGPLMNILTEAFQVKPFQIQGPDWITREVYELDARMPDGTTPETARLMLQTTLAGRLGLKLRNERKETAVYILVVIPGTGKLEEVTPAPQGNWIGFGKGRFEDPAMTPTSLARTLSNAAGRPVLDETGLTGYYKVKLQWTVDTDTPGAIGIDPGIVSALPQIGLKLEPAKRMLDHLVIENINKEPTAN